MNAQATIEPISGAFEFEQGLLGACLTNHDVLSAVSGALDPEHFGEEIHQHIWRVMQELLRAGRVANPVTIGAFLPKIDLRPGETIAQYIAHLCADTFCPATAVPDFAKQIRAAWGRGRCWRLSRRPELAF